MNILITGVAGFIGSNIAMHLTKNKKNMIFGIDKLDNYYSVKIKKLRLKELNKSKNFLFKKIDLVDEKKTYDFIKSKNIKLIIHMAAQAGVRYSFENPSKYIDSNINSFLNVIFSAKKLNINKIIYASSSSVYGENRNFPLSEKEITKPINIYGVTKKLNESIAETYQKISKIKFIGLRFFTIYGEWGRPDMFIYKLFKAFKLKKQIELNNYGNHERDFTYIKDVNIILEKLLFKNNKKHLIFNICSNNPKNILKIVKKFNIKKNLNIKFINQHKADVLKTHGNNAKIKKFLEIKNFSTFDSAFEKTFKWYTKKKLYKI
tara:strand:+ start:59 stop:1015 length:957 start_codon:yes stop_codon:yes gene_type:complete